MIRKIVLASVVLGITTSCVSKKIYQDLESKYADVKKERNALADENEALTQSKNQLELERNNLQVELEKLKAEHDNLVNNYTASQNRLETLKASYDALEKNSNDVLASNMQQNRELLAELDAKQKKLTAEQERLHKLKSDLEASSTRLAELEKLISDKEVVMQKLKETLSKALNSFEGKGLTVENRNGKVYVSMENKLLFESGSWLVGSEGKKAVKALGNVLADNPEVSVLIEGHTDDDKIVGNIGAGIKSNWDLSTKRATAIVNILSENKKIDKKNLTAAGRSEFAPLTTNNTNEGKAKNRRIEIILTPKLDEINKIMSEL